MNSAAGPTVTPAEVRLVQRAATGDRDARRELFELYRESAYRVALRITGRNEDALDVTQDSFIRAFERLGDFQGDATFRTWLLRIVSNRALDVLRARKVRLAVPIDSPADDDPRAELPAREGDSAPGQELEARELGERLRMAIEKLPTEQRSVFALYASGEMTYAQIADVLGVPLGTVMSRLYHARRKLHELLPDLAPRSADSRE